MKLKEKVKNVFTSKAKKEAKRKAKEAEARRKAEEAEARRKEEEAEAEARRKAEEAEAERKAFLQNPYETLIPLVMKS